MGHKNIDKQTRERLARYLRLKMAELDLNQRQMAARLGVHEGNVSRALQGGAIGLDFFIAMHRRLHVSANALLDEDPKPER